jgi:hypothetical protein
MSLSEHGSKEEASCRGLVPNKMRVKIKSLRVEADFELYCTVTSLCFLRKIPGGLEYLINLTPLHG